MTKPLQVAILGAGAVALGSAALLASRGHRPVLWSPSGASAAALRHTSLTTQGALVWSGPVAVAPSCAAALAQADAVLVALPANGYRVALDEAAAALQPRQPVLISGHLSLAGLYLSRLLHQRGVAAPIAAWGTTAVSARRLGPAELRVGSVRAELDLAALPHSAAADMLALCRTLLGDCFRLRDGLLAIALSNVNPQNHLAIALCNFTRIEHGEAWHQNSNITPAVGRLMEALDAERLALAAAFGTEVRTLRQHFHLSFHTPEAPLAEMARALAAAGNNPTGPATPQSRYVLEDAPFGLHPTIELARIAGCPAGLHQGGLDVLSAMYGRDLAKDNDILPVLGLDAMTADELRRLTRTGWTGP